MSRALAVALRLAALAFLVALLAAPLAFAPLFDWLTQNGQPAIYQQTPLRQLALDHLALVAVAVSLAGLVGIGAAVVVSRPAGREFLPLSRALANFGQTFPPVAVLALAVPILGFGAKPTLIALSLYALLPIFETTLTGMSSIPAQVIEAGRASGMSNRQQLWQVELPLCLPAILSGLRLATIISLATAAIGSTVAAKSLGEVIIAGLMTGNTAFIVQGGLILSLLAILINDAFRWAESRAARKLGLSGPSA